MKEQLRRGSFEPVHYEVSFSPSDELKALTIPLEGHESMRLSGRIDRMDLYEDDKNVYVKIIDYKSGVTTFDLSSVYYGLQLQLVVYMEAAMETEKKKHLEKTVIPAGIFYYNIKDPVIEENGDMESSQIESELLSKLKMNGLVNSSKEVISLLDKNLEQKSEVIPVSYNKDGTLAKGSSTVDAKEFQTVTNYVRRTIQRMGKEILDGNTQISPYRMGTENGCTWCEFKEICGFDEKTAGYAYRILPSMKADEVLEKMKNEREQREDEH